MWLYTEVATTSQQNSSNNIWGKVLLINWLRTYSEFHLQTFYIFYLYTILFIVVWLLFQYVQYNYL